MANCEGGIGKSYQPVHYYEWLDRHAQHPMEGTWGLETTELETPVNTIIHPPKQYWKNADPIWNYMYFCGKLHSIKSQLFLPVVGF